MKLYFTFGIAEHFPEAYRDHYIVVYGKNQKECFETFQKEVPDENEGILNCSDYYTATQWDNWKLADYYPEGPVKVFYSQTYRLYRSVDKLVNLLADKTGQNVEDEDFVSMILSKTGLTEEEYSDIVLMTR